VGATVTGADFGGAARAGFGETAFLASALAGDEPFALVLAGFAARVLVDLLADFLATDVFALAPFFVPRFAVLAARLDLARFFAALTAALRARFLPAFLAAFLATFFLAIVVLRVATAVSLDVAQTR
jgi:hypothetical protein